MVSDVFRNPISGQQRTTGRPPSGVTVPIPAPSRGMNTLDNYLSLTADQARFLENWLPTTGRCSFRKGYSASSTVSGATGIVSLMEYRGASGTTLIASDNVGKIVNASVDPATELASGYTASPWSSENANGYLLACNGTDAPWIYNGTALSPATFSGVALTSLRTVRKIKFGTGDAAIRLWFTVNGSADVWYGDPSAIAGTLTCFQLSQIASGGYCTAIFAWRDYTVFVMSTGEVLVYSGDPGSTFSIYGTYWMPKPVGYDAFVEIASDVVLMTVAGPRPMELIAAGLAFDVDSLQGWGKIGPSWADDWKSYNTHLGWNAIYHDGIAYFNVPTSQTTSKQYVCNLNVPGGAWTTYGNMHSCQWAQTAGGIFFGDKANGRVCQHTGSTDDGEDVIATSRQGFVHPTGGKSSMQYTMARLNYITDGVASAAVHVDVDFQDTEFSTVDVPLSQEGGSGPWDEPWDEPWGSDPKTQLRWQKVKGYGKAVAPAVRVRATASTFDWFATDVIATPGGML